MQPLNRPYAKQLDTPECFNSPAGASDSVHTLAWRKITITHSNMYVCKYVLC